jgi:hypothetical protein
LKRFILLLLVLFVLVTPFNAFAFEYALPGLPSLVLPDEYEGVYDYIVVGTTDYYDSKDDWQYTHIALLSKVPLKFQDSNTWWGYHTLKQYFLYNGVWYASDTTYFESTVDYVPLFVRHSFLDPVFSNYDVYYFNSSDVFFSLPVTLQEIVQDLPLLLLSQVRVILPCGILVLSLIILVRLLRKGLTIFFPR